MCAGGLYAGEQPCPAEHVLFAPESRSEVRGSRCSAKDGVYDWVHVRIGRHPDRSGIPGQLARPALPELVGSWRLSYEDRDAAGMVAYPDGKTPAGLLIFDSTGDMAVQLMKTPPPDVASDDRDRFTMQEKVAFYDGYVAYFGRYEVDLTRKVVTHLPEADLSRLYIGRREERHYELTGYRLVLSDTWTPKRKAVARGPCL